MKQTRERIFPKEMKATNGMLLEHVARYDFAKAYVHGRVLDIACGSGYGSVSVLEMQPNVAEYVGVDISEEAIEYAKVNYPHSKASYFIGDALNLKLKEQIGIFDTIISYETIEHFYGDQLFIENLYNLLKPGGTLLISTPFGRGVGQPCSTPYHVHQYKEEEFIALLNPFKTVIMYHQIGKRIEIPRVGQKYYLMLAVCKK